MYYEIHHHFVWRPAQLRTQQGYWIVSGDHRAQCLQWDLPFHQPINLPACQPRAGWMGRRCLSAPRVSWELPGMHWQSWSLRFFYLCQPSPSNLACKFRLEIKKINSIRDCYLSNRHVSCSLQWLFPRHVFELAQSMHFSRQLLRELSKPPCVSEQYFRATIQQTVCLLRWETCRVPPLRAVTL